MALRTRVEQVTEPMGGWTDTSPVVFLSTVVKYTWDSAYPYEDMVKVEVLDSYLDRL
jgi:hypothetical protein